MDLIAGHAYSVLVVTRNPQPTRSNHVMKPIKTKLTKSQLINHLVESTEPEFSLLGDISERARKKIVVAVLNSFEDVIARSIMPKGYGKFMWTKVLKVTLKTKKAIKAGTMVRSPAAGEMVPSKGRPKSKSVKIKPLANLKRAAAGES